VRRRGRAADVDVLVGLVRAEAGLGALPAQPLSAADVAAGGPCGTLLQEMAALGPEQAAENSSARAFRRAHGGGGNADKGDGDGAVPGAVAGAGGGGGGSDEQVVPKGTLSLLLTLLVRRCEAALVLHDLMFAAFEGKEAPADPVRVIASGPVSSSDIRSGSVSHPSPLSPLLEMRPTTHWATHLRVMSCVTPRRRRICPGETAAYPRRCRETSPPGCPAPATPR